MKHLYTVEKMNDTYVAYGCFDGVHKGHLAVLEELAARGKKDGKMTVAVSCCPQEMSVGVLSTEEEKAYYIEKMGIDCLISYPAEEALSAEEFAGKVILDTLGATLVVTGEQDPDAAYLKGKCEVVLVEPVLYKDEVISSALVKKYFMDCKFEEVTAMCGHTYAMIGEVVHGKALGRTVGMPTANLGVADTKLKPPSGVYATRTIIGDETYQGLTNIGTRPSVDDLPIITIETFLLEFSKDIYGRKLIMEVHLHIRGVRKFDSLEEVQNQVQKDLAQVKDYLDALS